MKILGITIQHDGTALHSDDEWQIGTNITSSVLERVNWRYLEGLL